MQTVFRVNGMTFRIHRDEWDVKTSLSLLRDFDEFKAWLNSTKAMMSDEDAEAALAAISEWTSYLKGRGIDTADRRLPYTFRR